jgi:hypothetical protein
MIGYDTRMDARKAKPASQSDPAEEWPDEPWTAADIAACEEAEAAVARGEWVDGAIVMAELRAMAARHRARAARARDKSTA